MDARMKIRKRERLLASPPAGTDQEWVEWQVVGGRKVVARCGTKQEAERALQKLTIGSNR